MDTKLLDILACPVCKGPLKLSADKTELISKGAGLAYPIRDGIPVMLETEARTRGAVTAFLEVASDNAPAQALYRAAGWQDAGRRRNYYAAGIDAVVMRKDL